MSHLSYIEKLLDGVEVEWKPLDDISVKISSGGTPKTGVAEFYDGDIPWLRTQEVNFDEIWDTGVKITEAGVDNSSAKWIPANCVIVAMYGATVGKIGINKIPMTTNQACANIQLDENIANYRYVFHFLLSQYEYIKSLGSGSQTNINAGIVKKLVVPIPCPDNPEKSLAIQAEIVRILDAFTAMTAELTAELNMRKKQYNYYRDQLLSFEEGEVEWKALGKIAEINTGQKPSEILDTEAEFDYINAGTTRSGYCALSNCEGDTVTTPSRGQGGIGFVGYQNKSFWLGPLCYKIRSIDNKELINKYLFYILQSKNQLLLGLKKEGGVPAVNKSDLAKLEVPVPSVAEQERIVEILDKFDTLTTSIQEGLPREIELRQKQYEYYRDLLLSFPKSNEGAA
ncbi:TPA: restriction endonuclease subunit S [Vibrio parahaemolyticus]|nr:restriction endonuclease subunit S [Vibrio parahaemolyticus]